MDFREAMDLLCLTGTEAAQLLGASPAAVRQARLDPGASGYRTPPPGWEKVFAKLARERRPALDELSALDNS